MSVPDSFNFCTPLTLREKESSLESVWLNISDFGEYANRPSESQIQPCISPVYNGKPLLIPPKIVHASLSGISIKHYNGNCFPDAQEDSHTESTSAKNDAFDDAPAETFGYDWFAPEEKDEFQEEKYEFGKSFNISMKGATNRKKSAFSSSKTSASLSPEGSVDLTVEQKPMCVRSKINFRNSFWNLHRPELCKLTWPNRYVSTSTVTEHLHQHLINHGRLCAEFHDEKDRENMLTKELDDYVRLKEILAPRILPPEEKPVDFKVAEKVLQTLSKNPRCRVYNVAVKVPVVERRERFLSVGKDESAPGTDIHRSKEEFCLTIGKHMRRPPITSSSQIVASEEVMTEYIVPFSAEEEGEMYPNWDFFAAEQTYEGPYESMNESLLDEESLPLVDPCPPLMLDDFCRGMGKIDLSDLRCNPDDF